MAAIPRTCLLLGDSHLAHMTKRRITLLEQQSSFEVLNAAVGGWTSADLARTTQRLMLVRPDAAVISVGANDAAPWGAISVDEFDRHLRSVISSTSGTTCLVLLVPPLDEAVERDRSNDEREPYRERARAACLETGAIAVDVWDELLEARAAGSAVHDADGAHLNDHGYQIMVAALARALAAHST